MKSKILGVRSKRAGLPNGKGGKSSKKLDNRATNISIVSHNSVRIPSISYWFTSCQNSSSHKPNLKVNQS
ncbi:hypothetical protein P3L10_032756 [Capsicum annuum]